MAEASYTGKDITVLEGLEPVRLRRACTSARRAPGASITSVFEVVDNSVDEAMAGRADLVEVTLHPDNSVTVTDNGSGIPTE
jgi:Type IIA topoisomerase (DNA gyrase/topo II, topoisomerase IV), B subunit